MRQFLRKVADKISKLIFDEDGEIRWVVYQIFAICAGVIILVAYAFHGALRWKSAAVGLLIAGASLAAGVLIGFLFGIPRTLQRSDQSSASTSGGNAANAESFGVNTNLEQISDWLTKIIVGVGLVQLTVIPGKLRLLADYLALAFGEEKVPSAAVIGIICYFAIFGFLLGYLWTRIYLTKEFSRVEQIKRDRPEYSEGLIHAYLYQPMPTGFENAIKEGLRHKERFEPNDRVWSYLACAYGQQRTYEERAMTPDAARIKEATDRALEAVTSALQINPDAREFLYNLWDPAVAKAPENDLVVFYDEPKFKEKLGNPTKTRVPVEPQVEPQQSRS